MSKQEKYNILYVDDEKSNLNSFRNLFRRKFNILTAESGKDALELMNENEVHLVITDQRMPQMTGIEFIEEAKKEHADLPFILLTGYTDHEVLKDAVNRVGIFRYVNKPFDPDSMSNMLDLSLESYQLQKDKVSLSKDLAVSQERLSKIAETAIDAIITVDEEQIIIVANEAAEKMFGYKKEELIGKSITELMPEAKKEHHADHVKNFAKSKVESKYMNERQEAYAIRSNGDLFPIETALSKMRIDKKNYFNAIVRDISERKESEQKLKESEKKFKDVFNSILDVFIRVDREGKIILVSPSAFELTGYHPEELLGQKAVDFYTNPEERDQLVGAIAEKGYCRNFETTMTNKSGDIRFVSLNAKVYLDSNNKPAGVESLLRDVTKKKLIEAKLRESELAFTRKLEQKVEERTAELKKTQEELSLALSKEKELGELKSRFVATVSHQFRTPLTVIQTNLALLAMKMNEAEGDLKRSMETVYTKVKHQIQRMTELMDDILILGKINAGRIDPQFVLVDAVKLCEEIVNNYDETQQDGRKVNFVVEGEPYKILLDDNLMNQAISNLLSNAFKYSIGKRDPDLLLFFDKKSLTIKVIDHGIGIPEDDLPHLFDPFYRASNVGEVSGTGLGTAIAKEYVELNKGVIKVNSKLGKGTTFHIELNK